jgi:hypothetical protein
MSVLREPFVVGQKVHLLVTSGQLSGTRYEVVRVWLYPTTFRYLLDTGYVADHSELRAVEGAELPVVAAVAAQAVPPAEATPDLDPDAAE